MPVLNRARDFRLRPDPNRLSYYMASTAFATFRLADRLPVRAEVLVRLEAPMDATGARIIFRGVSLIIHLFIAEMLAGKANTKGVFGGLHIFTRRRRRPPAPRV